MCVERTTEIPGWLDVSESMDAACQTMQRLLHVGNSDASKAMRPTSATAWSRIVSSAFGDGRADARTPQRVYLSCIYGSACFCYEFVCNMFAIRCDPRPSFGSSHPVHATPLSVTVFPAVANDICPPLTPSRPGTGMSEALVRSLTQILLLRRPN